MASFKLKKRFLVGLASWLNEQRLSGGASRARTRFIEILAAAIQQNEKDRLEMLDKVVEKDEEGKPKKIAAVDNQPEQWDIPTEKMPALEVEYAALMDEEFVLDVMESNRSILKSVRHILLETDYLFGPRGDEPTEEIVARIRQMNDYPIWCEAFETLDLEE